MCRAHNSLFSSLMWIGKCIDYNYKLACWLAAQSGGIGGRGHLFSNQAFNTLYNYSCTPFSTLQTLLLRKKECILKCATQEIISPIDARNISDFCHVWITDPPYADAINYHELTNFYLAWYEKHIPKAFPEWYTDTKKALAVRGSGKDFKHAMVDVYTNLAEHMPDNGLQLVMFTHQDASVIHARHFRLFKPYS